MTPARRPSPARRPTPEPGGYDRAGGLSPDIPMHKPARRLVCQSGGLSPCGRGPAPAWFVPPYGAALSGGLPQGRVERSTRRGCPVEADEEYLQRSYASAKRPPGAGTPQRPIVAPTPAPAPLAGYYGWSRPAPPRRARFPAVCIPADALPLACRAPSRLGRH
jgi:hypothetical protein